MGRASRSSVSGGDIPKAPQFRVSDDTIVLGDDLRPAPPGVVGRLARRGPIPLGYYKDPGEDRGDVPGGRRGALGRAG